jgi:uncharacterized protein
MTREQAINLVQEKISNANLIKHCLAVEAVMKGLAEHFNEDKEKWGLAGLLHDIDYEQTKADPLKHSLIGSGMLKDLSVDEDICLAVLTHNEAHNLAPESLMAKALFVTDPLTGLIIATTLVLPNKKISEVTVENILNRFKEKGFARGANREIIKQTETLLILPLAELVGIGLGSMQRINNDLGL